MTAHSGIEKRIGLATLAFARKQTLAFLEDITQAQAVHQPFPGANHAAWIAGHIAWADDFFLTTLKPRKAVLPETYTKLFGMGSTPTADASTYPKLEQLREKLSQLREEMVAWFGNMPEQQLHASLPKEFDGFAENFAMLMSTISWHEGMHAGQLTVLRKSLGMKPKVA